MEPGQQATDRGSGAGEPKRKHGRQYVEGGLALVANVGGVLALASAGATTVAVVFALIALIAGGTLLVEQWGEPVRARILVAVVLMCVGALIVGGVTGARLRRTAASPSGAQSGAAGPTGTSSPPPVTTTATAPPTQTEPPTSTPQTSGPQGSVAPRYLTAFTATGDSWLTGTWQLAGIARRNSLAARHLCTDSTQTVVFDVGGRYRRFTADVGVSDDARISDQEATVDFNVYADRNENGSADTGEQVATRGAVYRRPAHIDAAIDGVKQIILEVYSPGLDCFDGTAVWGSAQVS